MLNRIKSIFTFVISVFNRPLFYYRLHHYMNTPVTEKKAIRFREKNKHSYRFKDVSFFNIATYDYSGQAVHPHCLCYGGKTWLVLTPYPYGMEEYENPCIYFGNSIDELNEYTGNPIAVQSKRTQGIHLSDPVLFVFNDKLYCCYRSTEKKESDLVNNILYKEIINRENNLFLSEEKQFLSSKDNQLLSPAFFTYDNNLYLMFPDYFNSNNSLLVYRVNDCLVVKDSFVMKCKNVPDGYGIWHIDVKNDDNQIKGLFLLKDTKRGKVFKLYLARLIEFKKGIWELESEIVISKNIERIKMHLYKSTFIPNTKEILLSLKDKKSRYHLIKLGGIEYD